MSLTGSAEAPSQQSDSHRTTIGMDTDTPSTETSDCGIHVPILRATNYMDWRRRLIGCLVSKDLHLCASRPLSAAAEAVLQVAIDDRSRGFHSPLERLDFAKMQILGHKTTNKTSTPIHVVDCGPDFSASCTLTYRKALIPRSHLFCDSSKRVATSHFLLPYFVRPFDHQVGGSRVRGLGGSGEAVRRFHPRPQRSVRESVH
ncbi:BZ3500_MvSof-1268-A1-R1_Chr1-3g02431 [Microbotryum saponariae]|uniref:BZ3500_MvSof-1268-A1-R1_Chr1-3g02431 protein n=1 Tax=Microbotryum saponariae TaxID=289078 RepID=A0A2X0KH71_9BASI|nr:BZ3500_MvSof-1268-A1-R1_Chr1-3g02431 [Microbotryum saponariae]SCZ96218.1 BZ3501_MvSof-1269-A2-R1_Chr1-3g02034 [Microbotryum saponariae]